MVHVDTDSESHMKKNDGNSRIINYTDRPMFFYYAASHILMWFHLS